MKIGVDVNAIPESQMGSGLVDGDYVALVSAIDPRPTKDTLGEELNVELTINGQKVWDNLVYRHETNQQRVEIGLSRWKDLCQACGFLQGDVDTAMVVGKNVKVRLKTKGTYQNVAFYKSAVPNQQPAPAGGLPKTPPAGWPTQAQQPPAHHQQGQPFHDDDVPF